MNGLGWSSFDGGGIRTSWSWHWHCRIKSFSTLVLRCFRILLENLASCSVFSVPTDYRNDTLCTQTLVPDGGLKLFWDEVLMS